MGSTYDTGKTQDKANSIRDTPCREGGTHVWEEHGSWPSLWWECLKCRITIYSK